MGKEVHDAVKAVVRHSEEEKFLVVQRSSHDSMPLKWEFPGGGVDDSDDSVKGAALRELEEETGLNGEVLRRGDSGKVELNDRILEFHIFEVEVSEREVELSREHRDFRWVSKEKIEKLDSEERMQQDLEAIDEWDMKNSRQ
jgi:8-oxo-dGTP pyrophosphatase MutT (NUDIX family)